MPRTRQLLGCASRLESRPGRSRRWSHVRGALVFGLITALVAGVAMAATLLAGHELGNLWWLVPASAGAAGVVGIVLGAVAHVFTRTR